MSSRYKETCDTNRFCMFMVVVGGMIATIMATMLFVGIKILGQPIVSSESIFTIVIPYAMICMAMLIGLPLLYLLYQP